MGHKLVATWLAQDSSLQPDYWLILVFGVLPSVILLALEVTTVVLALTDRGLTGPGRYVWPLLIVVCPLIGMLAYVVLRGRQRLRRWEAAS